MRNSQCRALLKGAIQRLQDTEAFDTLDADFHYHSAKPYAALRFLKTLPPQINSPDNRPAAPSGNGMDAHARVRDDFGGWVVVAAVTWAVRVVDGGRAEIGVNDGLPFSNPLFNLRLNRRL